MQQTRVSQRNIFSIKVMRMTSERKPLKKGWVWYFFWIGFAFFFTTTIVCLGLLTYDQFFARPHIKGKLTITSLLSGDVLEWRPDTCTYGSGGIGLSSKQHSDSLSVSFNVEKGGPIYMPISASWSTLRPLNCSRLTGIINAKPHARPGRSSLLSDYWTGGVDLVCQDPERQLQIVGNVGFSYCGLTRNYKEYITPFLLLIPIGLYLLWRKLRPPPSQIW